VRSGGFVEEEGEIANGVVIGIKILLNINIIAS
jgi:hypothetical protein